jgi:hypothetical protein
MTKKINQDKENAEISMNTLFLCMAYKMKNKDENIDCSRYLEIFKNNAIKYMDNKETKT